jgi:MFS family permease
VQSESNWRNLVAACGAISVFGLAFGMTYPLLSLILESRGVSADMIGINSAMMPIGVLLFASVIPLVSARFGTRNVAIAAAVAAALLTISYKVFDNLATWFFIRLLMGMAISTLFVLSEAWIVRFASAAHRGRVVAIYGSVLSASFGAGPALVGWIGIDGWTPFVVGALVLLAGVAPLSLVRDDRVVEPKGTRASGLFSFAGKAPVLLAAVGVFAIFDAATLSLLPVYGIRNGLDVATASIALSALILGNIVLQFPIGYLADRFPRRRVMGGCALITAITLASLPMVMATAWMWPTLVVCGAAGYGIYTVALADLGDRFSGQELVTGASAFAVMWGSGALLGSVSGGWAMTGFGIHGLPGFLSLTYFAFFVALYVRQRANRQASNG